MVELWPFMSKFLGKFRLCGFHSGGKFSNISNFWSLAYCIFIFFKSLFFNFHIFNLTNLLCHLYYRSNKNILIKYKLAFKKLKGWFVIHYQCYNRFRRNVLRFPLYTTNSIYPILQFNQTTVIMVLLNSLIYCINI